ncbi:hypothetical protein DFJ77DRAFT_508554 [Powellomyces hirtus]|nr:hypothetical protein DFJ77DRAFT_508554 [Powellomyces hirtus]
MQHLAEAEDLLAMVRARVSSEEVYASNFLELGRHSGSVSAGPSTTKEQRRYSRASTPAIAAGTMTGLTGDKNRMSLNHIAQGLGNAAAMLQSAAASSRLPGTTGWNMTAEPDSDTSTVGPIDDESSVRPVIRTLREQMVAMAAAHRRHADTLTMAVISPLQAFVEQHRRVMTKKKSEVDLNHQQLARLAADIEARHTIYIQKCKIAEEEDRKFRQDGESRASRISNGPVMIGSRSVGPNEFQKIVETMRKEVKTKSIMTELGLFEGCFMGEDAVEHLKKKYPGIPRGDLRLICMEILARRLMAPLIGPNDGSFDPQLPYQFGRPLLKSGEPPHVKARKDSEMARLDYDSAIKTAEHTRSALEFHITDYLLAAQEAERYRLKVTKEAVLAFEAAQVFVLEEMQTAWRPPALVDTAAQEVKEGETPAPATLLVSPDPEEGVQYIARRHRTGHLRSKPFVFESYKNGRAPHQVFGIGLEELSKVTKTPIPPIVRRCVSALYESLLSGRSSVETWITPNPDLPSVQFLRMEFNASPRCGRVSATTLKRYQPQVHAGVLKLYLVEAPVSLCSYDTYETLRMLYSDDFQTLEDEVRIKSVKSLLSTLSPPHYETLKFFTGYLHELVKPLDENDERIIRLAYTISPCILRPSNETPETLQDQHPWRFSLELMVRHIELFGDVDKAALMLEITSPPSPEPEDESEGQDDLPLSGINTHVTPVRSTEATPPGTPPLREPVGAKGQGSWFPWPLTGTGATATTSQAEQLSPDIVESPTNERSTLQADKAVKAERRTSRLEDRLAGVLAKAKGSVPVPTDDVDETPQTSAEVETAAATPIDTAENPWSSLKSFLGQKKPSTGSLSSKSSASQPSEVPRSVDQTQNAVPVADKPEPIATTTLPADPVELSPEYIAAREVIVEKKPSIYRSPSVASVASVAKSFLGSVVSRSLGSPKEEPVKAKEELSPKSVPAPAPAPAVVAVAPAAAAVAATAAVTMVPVEAPMTTSPYEDVINADHAAAHEEPEHEDAASVIEEGEEEQEHEEGAEADEDEEEVYTESESVYEEGEDGEGYTDGEGEYEEEYEEEEEDYEETDETYEEAEEVVIDDDDDGETEENAGVQPEQNTEQDVEMRNHMFPGSAQEMSEYLQWG